VETELGNWQSVFRDTMFELFLAERDFRVHQTNAYILHFERIADNLGRVLGVSVVKPEAKKEITEALGAYTEAFSQWSDAVQLSETVYNRFTANHVLLMQEIDQLHAVFAGRAGEARSEQAAIASTQRMSTIGAFAAVVALSALMALMMGMRISRDMRKLSGATLKLATGDIDAEVPRIGRKDEIGAMADALVVLREGVIERQQLVSAQSAASGERLARAQSVEKAIGAFESSIGRSLSGLHDVSGAMQSVSGELDQAAVEAEAQAISAAGDTEKASSEIEAAAVAAQQLSSSVEEVASQATKSDEAAAGALKQADRARSVMGEMMTQADRVGEVVGVISAIAAQTNLLALNATIEAARAGEAGKGFAVVAAEVKDLAAQTAAATGEIAGQIGGIRQASQGVMAAVDSMNVTIAEVSRIAGSVAAAVEEQAASLTGLSRNIVAASEGASRGANGIRTVESAVADTTRNAARVRDISRQVADEAAKLNDQVAWFLNEVRAA
jgi:methyl-accepting chemotaxis protein